MDIYAKLKSWIEKPATPMTTFIVDPKKCDVPPSGTAIEANRHYVRVRMARMFLRNASTWTQQWLPAVQSYISFQFGNGQAEIPNVADASRAKLQQTGTGDLVIRNMPLTPTVPFHGGLVSISASLIAMKGQNGFEKFVDVLGGFASVLQTPQFAAALTIAKPLMNGLGVLLDTDGNKLHLGYFNSFSAGQLSDGYIAVIRAPKEDLDQSKLFIVGDGLCQGTGTNEGEYKDFTQFDYMLLRTEVFDHRDDYDALTAISEQWKEIETTMATQNSDWEGVAKGQLRSVLLRVLQSNELTRVDRARIGNEFRARFTDLLAQFSQSGATGKPWPTLSEIELGSVPSKGIPSSDLDATLSALLD